MQVLQGLSAISQDIRCFFLVAIEGEYAIDICCILQIYYAGSHHAEDFHLAVVKRENLHDANDLGTGIIASETCYFYQVELVVIKVSLLYLVVQFGEGSIIETIAVIKLWPPGVDDIRIEKVPTRFNLQALLVSVRVVLRHATRHAQRGGDSG